MYQADGRKDMPDQHRFRSTRGRSLRQFRYFIAPLALDSKITVNSVRVHGINRGRTSHEDRCENITLIVLAANDFSPTKKLYASRLIVLQVIINDGCV